MDFWYSMDGIKGKGIILMTCEVGNGWGQGLASNLQKVNVLAKFVFPKEIQTIWELLAEKDKIPLVERAVWNKIALCVDLVQPVNGVGCVNAFDG